MPVKFKRFTNKKDLPKKSCREEDLPKTNGFIPVFL